MRVGDKQIFYLVALDVLGEKMMVSVGRKVDQKIIIYERLRTCADILAAELARFAAVLTVAEYSGESLRRRSTEIFKLHNLAPFG